ncbi:MAG: TIGR02206 family membrane protein [Oscillospiraceae bacterium]|jgi:hypothetical integral membrane protein (TIGR02206 family)|nr:TIGR02206 family membrane protein [Oscillospiraceae bacterium]
MPSCCFAFYTASPFPTFKRYGTTHILALLLILFAIISIIVFKKRITHKADKIIRIIATIPAIAAEISHNMWNYINKDNFVGNLFSLDLCHISTFLSLFLNLSSLFQNHKIHKKVFPLLYFWSMGAIAAFLFPSLEYGPEKIRFYHFFYAHAYIILTAIYCLFVDNYKITFKSYLSAIGILTVIAFIVGVIDAISGQNYMFLMPALYSRYTTVKTPLNSLGEGHIYYVNLFLLGTACEFIMFFPHMLKNNVKKTKIFKTHYKQNSKSS